MRYRIKQLGDSTAELTKMSIELTIEEHCNFLRQQVDIARETGIENIHKASNTLMSEIDTYEQECLSSWTEQANESVPRPQEANKLAQELKAAMFDNKLASFIAYPNDVFFGELTFTHITVPFKSCKSSPKSYKTTWSNAVRESWSCVTLTK